MGGEGGFVVLVEAPAVLDQALGGFDHPAAGLHREAILGFGAGHDIDGELALGGEIENRAPM